MQYGKFSIGKVSEETGINIETIRYYEKIKLLDPPPRSTGGRREYDISAVKKLHFIRNSRSLGLSLDTIRSLVELNNEPQDCATVMDVAQAHLTEIRSKRQALERLETTLQKYLLSCEQNANQTCPLIEVLWQSKIQSDLNR